MTHRRITPPTIAPVDLTMARVQCRLAVDDTAEDALLSLYIDAAAEYLEGYTGWSFTTQTHKVTECDFPEEMYLPFAAPLASVTYVKYYDASNALTTLSSSVYTVPENEAPALIRRAYTQVWPAVYDREDAVIVEYVTGTADPANVPFWAKQAILLLVGHWFANRETVIVGTISGSVQFAVDALCAPHRLFLHRNEWESD